MDRAQAKSRASARTRGCLGLLCYVVFILMKAIE